MPDASLAEARRVLRLEADAVLAVERRLGEEFAQAVELIHAAVGDGHGRVIVSGIGKSGIVARKIAATLTSTGTPSLFVHPVEGLHGDLGIVSERDVALLLSKSGATEELRGLLEYFGRVGIPVIALTGDGRSELATAAQIVLDAAVAEEACPLDLAPTSSTTVQMALGDALAVVLLHRRGFREDDFARLHPGGALGRRLTVRVADVMERDDYPSLAPDASMRACVVLLANKRGTVPIVDEDGRVQGVVTAGDLTRLMERQEDFLDLPVGDVMTRTPKVAAPADLASSAAHVMEEFAIMALPVVDDCGRLQGVIHLHDLMRARVV